MLARSVGRRYQFYARTGLPASAEVRDSWGGLADQGPAGESVTLKVKDPGWYKRYVYGKEARKEHRRDHEPEKDTGDAVTAYAEARIKAIREVDPDHVIRLAVTPIVARCAYWISRASMAAISRLAKSSVRSHSW